MPAVWSCCSPGASPLARWPAGSPTSRAGRWAARSGGTSGSNAASPLATRVLIVTEGMLTNYLHEDPLLSDVSTVVLDEFHERSLHTDLGLALVADAWRARDDLRVIVMSATMDPAPGQRLSRWLPAGRSARRHAFAGHHLCAWRGDDDGTGVGAAGGAGRRSLLPAGRRRHRARAAGCRAASGSPPRGLAAAPWIARRRRAGPRDRAGAAEARRVRHEHRRDLADRPGRVDRDRHRAAEGGALRRRAGDRHARAGARDR